jgi:hypothetical protein
MIRITKTDNTHIVISKASTDFLSGNRLLHADYTSIDYTSIDNGDYAYIDIDNDPTGLLIDNGDLIYPLNGGSDVRNYYGLFKYTNANRPTLSQLDFIIDHTGNETDWLTDSGTGGTISSNKIKFEFLIKKETGIPVHDWYNPFAVYNSPYGVSNVLITRTGIVTKVSCTLSVFARVAFGDIVIVKIQASPSWVSTIRNINILNL